MHALPIHKHITVDPSLLGEPAPVYELHPVNQNQWSNEWLAGLNGGDAEAFTVTYNRLFPAVFYFACRFGDHQVARDITADIFFTLWKMEKQFKDMVQVKGFLQKAVRNAWISHKRHEKVERRYLGALEIDYDKIENPHISLEATHTELLQLVYNRIADLPPRCRKIFRMAYMESMKEKDIASKLGLSFHTVHAQKAKALRILRMQCSVITTIFLLVKILLPFA